MYWKVSKSWFWNLDKIFLCFWHVTSNKKLSYRRETARQLPTWREGGARPSRPPSAPSDYTHAYGCIRKPQSTYVKRAVRKAHFKMNRAFKVIQGHPYWCRQESRMVLCRNVQLMPTLFLKLTKIRQRQNGKFVDFNDLTQVSRRPSKKRLQISTNDLYCQKLELLTYIFVADSIGRGSLVFT